MMHRKQNLESKGLRLNLAITKVMISDINLCPTFTSIKHSCQTCCKGVAFNSIFCSDCA